MKKLILLAVAVLVMSIFCGCIAYCLIRIAEGNGQLIFAERHIETLRTISFE